MPTDQIQKLLSKLRQNFPAKLARTLALLRKAGGDDMDDLVQIVEPPKQVKSLPTFDKTVSRPLSPMLKSRFEVAGRWQEGLDVWLGGREMRKQMDSRSVRKFHKSLRDHWDDSAPMQFASSQLTLFGITLDVPENLTYLVWNEKIEPEVWEYSGMNFQRHKNLVGFFRSKLEE